MKRKLDVTVLPDGALSQIYGGMFSSNATYPYRPQAGPVYDYSIQARPLVSSMAQWGIPAALGGAALGPGGIWTGGVGGALAGGIAYTADRLINPPVVCPAMPLAVCHGQGGSSFKPSMMSCHGPGK